MSAWKPGDSVSMSSAFGWDECSAKWWFGRVLKIPAPDRSYFILGTVVHKIAQHQLAAKRDGVIPLSESDIAETIEKSLTAMAAPPPKLGPEAPDPPSPIRFSEGETLRTLIEDAVEIMRVWTREVFPQISPLSLEILVGPDDGLRLPESGTPVKAILDVIDADAAIRDLKTAKKKWSDGDAERRLQTSVYSWAYRVKFGVPPPKFKYDVIVRKKRGKKRTTAEAEYQPIEFVPDPLLEFSALRRLEAIAEQMRAGRYYPVTGRQCLDCNFEEFCPRHFAELPFAVPPPAQAAPADGPRYLSRGPNNAAPTSPGPVVPVPRLLAIRPAPDREGGHGAIVLERPPEAPAGGVPDGGLPGPGEAV